MLGLLALLLAALVLFPALEIDVDEGVEETLPGMDTGTGTDALRLDVATDPDDSLDDDGDGVTLGRRFSVDAVMLFATVKGWPQDDVVVVCWEAEIPMRERRVVRCRDCLRMVEARCV